MTKHHQRSPCKEQQFQAYIQDCNTYSMAQVLAASLNRSNMNNMGNMSNIANMRHIGNVISRGNVSNVGNINTNSTGLVSHLEPLLTKDVVNMKDQNGNTVLHHACKSDYSLTLYLLTGLTADLSTKNNRGKTALDLTILESQDAIALLCIENCSLSFTDEGGSGHSSLDLAMINSKYDIVVQILYQLETQLLADCKDIHQLSIKQDNTGSNIMHYAATNDFLHLINFMLLDDQYSILVNSQNKHGAMPLHILCGKKHKNLAPMSVGRWGSGKIYSIMPPTQAEFYIYYTLIGVTKITDVNLRDKCGFTCLELAFENINFLAFTAIMSALHEEIDNRLLFKIQIKDINDFNTNGETLLITASRFNAPLHSIRKLVELGADPYVKPGNGHSAFELAVLLDYREIVEVFVMHAGVDFNPGLNYHSDYVRLIARHFLQICANSELQLMDAILLQKGIDTSYPHTEALISRNSNLLEFKKDIKLAILILQCEKETNILQSVFQNPEDNGTSTYRRLWEESIYCIPQLLGLGAAVNDSTKEGYTAVDCCVMAAMAESGQSYHIDDYKQLTANTLKILLSAGAKSLSTKFRNTDNALYICSFLIIIFPDIRDDETFVTLKLLGLLNPQLVPAIASKQSSEYFQKPLDLQILCAAVIRTNLHPNAWVGVGGLPVSPTISKYITCDHEQYLSYT